MPVETVIDVDLVRVLNNAVKPKAIQWKGSHTVKVGLDIDKKVYEVFDQDPLAYAKIRDPISDRYEDFVSKASKLYKTADRGIAANVGRPKKIKEAIGEFEKGLTAELKALHKDVPKIADAEWNKYKKTNKQYSSYKLRGFIKTALSIVGVVLSALGLGSAVATGGLTALIGIKGMATSLKSLHGELTNLMAKAEKVRKELDGNISALKKEYRKKSGAMKGMTEVGKVLVEKVLGKEFKTIAGCRKNLRLFLDKLAGVDVSAHGLARELQRLLKQVDEARKTHGDIINANSKLASDMAKLEKEIDTLIKKIIAKQDEVKSGTQWSKDAKDKIDLIEAGRPGWTTALEKGLIAYDVVMSAKDFDKSVTSIMDLASSIASTAQGIEDEYKSLKAGA